MNKLFSLLLFLFFMVDEFVEPFTLCAQDPLHGLTINVFGDSYVANHLKPVSESWHAKVAAAHGMKYNNYGRNGSCIAFDRERFGPAMLKRYMIMCDTADIVLIIAGHNDASMCGIDNDSLQIVRESLDSLLTLLRQKYPNGRIGWVTPWYVDRAGFNEVTDIIKEVCAKHDVPILDNCTADCVIKVRDSEFRRKYFQSPNDTAHLNDAGHNLFVPIGDQFLKSLVAQ